MDKKRVVDIALAAFSIVLLSPLFMAIALLIKLSSPGPIFYSQLRVGQFGNLFRIFKFRSMVQVADKTASSIVTDKDLRVTSLGKFLRKTKLDELPQLWNVIKGDLSLVGPRPDVPEIICMYSSEMRRVLEIKPGLTSVASYLLSDEQSLVSLATHPDIAYSKIIVPAKVNLNMEHLRRNSLWYDLSILLKTIYCLVRGCFLSEENPVTRRIKGEIIHLNEKLAKFNPTELNKS